MHSVISRIFLVRILIFIGILESIRFKLLNRRYFDLKKLTFLYFYSRGTPWDNGFNLSDTSRHLKLKLKPYFFKVISYNKQTLKEIPGSENFCNEFSEPLSKNPNANNFGYFDFKPFLINHVLNTLPNNEMLVYHDGNFVRNAQYWESDWKNFNSIVDYLMKRNRSSIWVQFEGYGNFVKNHTKEHTLNFFFNDKEKKIVKKSYLINAARIVVRNDEFGRAFIAKYMKYCEDKKLIFGDDSIVEDKDFLWSCGDQDVLNCLVYRYILDGNLDVLFPRFAFFYRVIRLDRKRAMLNSGLRKNHITTGIYPLYNYRLILYIIVNRVKGLF